MKNWFPLAMTLLGWAFFAPHLFVSHNTSNSSGAANPAGAERNAVHETDDTVRSKPFVRPQRPTVMPEFQHRPAFGVVAVGADREQQYWMVVDGEDLYFDFNLNGDLTDEDEKLAADEGFEFEGSKFSTYHLGEIYGDEFIHTDLKIATGVGADSVRATVSMLLDGVVQARNSHMTPRDLSFSVEDAPVFHFGGQLAMGLYDLPQQLPIGKEKDFYALVGTPGTGRKTLTAQAHADVPADVHPVATFRFENRIAGEPPLTVICHLAERC